MIVYNYRVECKKVKKIFLENFGSKVNAEPMEMLAHRVPHLILAKHKNQLFQIEALLFGQSGLLEDDFVDNYPQKLKKEFLFLQKKHNLHQPVVKTAWLE